MAEDNVNPTGPEQAPPPKIRLGLSKDGGPKPPAAGKPDTSRIDLADAEPSSVEAAGGGEPMSVREVLQDAPATTVRPVPLPPTKAQTSRISIHDSQPARPGEAVPLAKSATSRIPLRDSQPLATGETVPPAAPSAKAATGKVATGKVATGKVATGKVATGPVTPVTGGPAPGARPVMEEVTSQAQFNRTARISIEGPDEAIPQGGAVGDTGRIPVVAAGDANKAPPPKTVRLTRPAASPKTVPVQRTDGATPKTIMLKRPGGGGAPVVVPPGAAAPTVAAAPGPAAAAPKTVVLRKPEEGGGSLEEKGATSRINVPEGTLEAAPPTQRKTIRIKRSGEGGAGPITAAPKTISLVRPPKTEGAPATVAGAEGAGTEASEEEMARALGIEPEYDEPSALYSVIALLTMLVLGAALYVLAAQTVAPTLPFPGKIL